jgi:glutamate formiminotransferase
VGLVPEKALDINAEYFLKLENFRGDKVLESRIATECVRGRGEEGKRGK